MKSKIENDKKDVSNVIMLQKTDISLIDPKVEEIIRNHKLRNNK